MPGSQLVWVPREDELAQWKSHQGVAPGEVRSYAEKNVVCQLKNAQKMLTVTVQNSWETKPTGKVVRAPRKSEREMLLPAQDGMKK